VIIFLITSDSLFPAIYLQDAVFGICTQTPVKIKFNTIKFFDMHNASKLTNSKKPSLVSESIIFVLESAKTRHTSLPKEKICA
jgi:hypothetical protein